MSEFEVRRELRRARAEHRREMDEFRLDCMAATAVAWFLLAILVAIAL